MRYRLRTLMIVLAIGPMVLAAGWFASRQYQAWKRRDTWEYVSGPGAIGPQLSIRSYIDEDGNWFCTLVNDETGEEVSAQPNDHSTSRVRPECRTTSD